MSLLLHSSSYTGPAQIPGAGDINIGKRGSFGGDFGDWSSGGFLNQMSEPGLEVANSFI